MILLLESEPWNRADANFRFGQEKVDFVQFLSVLTLSINPTMSKHEASPSCVAVAVQSGISETGESHGFALGSVADVEKHLKTLGVRVVASPKKADVLVVPDASSYQHMTSSSSPHAKLFSLSDFESWWSHRLPEEEEEPDWAWLERQAQRPNQKAVVVNPEPPQSARKQQSVLTESDAEGPSVSSVPFPAQSPDQVKAWWDSLTEDFWPVLWRRNEEFFVPEFYPWLYRLFRQGALKVHRLRRYWLDVDAFYSTEPDSPTQSLEYKNPPDIVSVWGQAQARTQQALWSESQQQQPKRPWSSTKLSQVQRFVTETLRMLKGWQFQFQKSENVLAHHMRDWIFSFRARFAEYRENTSLAPPWIFILERAVLALCGTHTMLPQTPQDQDSLVFLHHMLDRHARVWFGDQALNPDLPNDEKEACQAVQARWSWLRSRLLRQMGFASRTLVVWALLGEVTPADVDWNALWSSVSQERDATIQRLEQVIKSPTFRALSERLGDSYFQAEDLA